ncbi:MAG: bacillithiol biosynthesis deacetylase BshB1 [Planctomycetota bacterium]
MAADYDRSHGRGNRRAAELIPMLDALVIAPHPDDAELGMGGTIALMLAQGLAVGVLDLTYGEPTPLGSPEIRSRETAAATAALGVAWRENLGLPNRRLRATLTARATLAGVIRRTRPRWLFAPHWVDAHPDHVAATRLTEAARFWAKLTKCDLPGEPWHPERIWYYACVHLRAVRRPAFVVDIAATWQAKHAAIASYASQFPETARQPTVPERVAAADAWWGSLIGSSHGEPFWSREPLGLRGFDQLV